MCAFPIGKGINDLKMSGKDRNPLYVWIPLLVASAISIGILVGSLGKSEKLTLSPAQEKLNNILSLIASDYVDELNVDDLIENVLPDLMEQLDPHSSYIPASELTSMNEDLDSKFSGVGISFQIINDTVTVVEVISGGPADKVGILNGDRIVMADTVPMAGPDVTNEDVFKNLRGSQGTRVNLKIKRSNAPELLSYDVVRDDVPVSSIDAAYMVDETIGYVKVGKFARNTYNEFLEALSDLKEKGAKKFVVDLRDNGGGLMDQAIYMVNEFLPYGKMIVYTKERGSVNNTEAVSDGAGNFQNSEIVVVTNEYSASASEIFAGAIQDNDRGLVIGRRTFGKGLVQNQTVLPDNSAIRLTVARYFTPSGRSIQKEYDRGKNGKYALDLVDRYNHGEFYSSDSIKLDKSKKYHTSGGRTVYGGGGIMPDIFVPEDSTGYTNWFSEVVNAGLVQKYAFNWTDRNREELERVRTLKGFEAFLPADNQLLNDFVAFTVKNGIKENRGMIAKSRNLLLNQLKAFLVRDAVGMNEMYKLLNRNDHTIVRAVEALRAGESPTLIREKTTKKK